MYEIILYDKKMEDALCRNYQIPWSLSCWQKHCGQLTYWK